MIIIIRLFALYNENMKKFLCALAPLFLLGFTACSSSPDYFDYVSEYRSSVYIFSEDGEELKIYCSRREAPYSSDGIKGQLNDTVEIFYSSDATADEVHISVGDMQGDMNYRSVTRDFYLCFTAEDEGAASVQATLTVDGKEKTIDVPNVRDEGVIDGRKALQCVLEYDGERFAALTKGNRFLGEINIRLLYDEGCYYYVGVCDREGNTYAYLLDGTDGRVLAEKD